MASRFKTSKYRSAFSYAYKKEFWINDLNVGSNLNSNGHHIASSCQYVAFNHDSNSQGSIAVLPLSSCGRFSSFPLIAGHAGFVTNFAFSPFDDALLATGAEDKLVKLWRIPDGGIQGVYSTSVATLGPMEGRIEDIAFHPSADNVCAVSAGPCVKLWDLEKCDQKVALGGHEDTVQSISWHGDGTLLATICKDGKTRKLRVFDPRANKCVKEGTAHTALKDASVLWLGDTNFVVTAGYGVTRDLELALWDIQDTTKPVALQSLGNATGSPMLFYDKDSQLLFTAAKSESTIHFFELADKSPYLSKGPHVCQCTTQVKGLTTVPKRAVDVMACQIVRFLQLAQSAIIPIGYHVQRKTTSEFHADLFPDTAGGVAPMSAQQWFDGANEKVALVSLNPLNSASSKKPAAEKKPAVEDKKPAAEDKKPAVEDKKPAAAEKPTPPPATKPAPAISSGVGRSPSAEKTAVPDKQKEPVGRTSSASSQPQRSQSKAEATEVAESAETQPSPQPKAAVSVVRSSKVRHVEGRIAHKSLHIEKLPKLSTTVPGDSNAFQANKELVAVVLAVPGGQIGVFELSKAGRLDTDALPTLQNVATVMDFVFDPFDNRKLVVACDDARIRVWRIPKDGAGQTYSEPDFYLIGHQEKPNILCFHPLASSILASSGYDCRLYIWNVDTKKVAITLNPVKEPLFSMAWSPCGKYLATISKDHSIRIYEPRASCGPVQEGEGPEGSRGARLAWLDKERIVVSGFNKNSLRTLSVYNIRDLKQPLSVVGTNISPATLMPFYDPDTHLLYLTGKGDHTILAFEYVADQEPYLFDVTPFSCGSPHQAISFLYKSECDVKQVEVAKGVRLCQTTIEPFTLRIPRVKTEFFQDDLFPDTLVAWEPAVTADQWLSGSNNVQKTISLRPEGMKLLSEGLKEAAPVAKKYQSYSKHHKTDQEKKEELLNAMINKMGDKDENPLPQSQQEGADSDEWED